MRACVRACVCVCVMRASVGLGSFERKKCAKIGEKIVLFMDTKHLMVEV